MYFHCCVRKDLGSKNWEKADWCVSKKSSKSSALLSYQLWDFVKKQFYSVLSWKLYFCTSVFFIPVFWC